MSPVCLNRDEPTFFHYNGSATSDLKFRQYHVYVLFI